MQDYVEKITHKLIKPFLYAYNGDQISAETITIQAPSNSIMNHIAVLEQEVASSFMKLKEHFKDEISEAAKDNQQQDDTNESGLQTLMLISGNGANLAKCFVAFREILTSGNTDFPVCKIDDQEKMIKPLFDKISTLDTKIMLGRYISNFIIASLGN